MPGIGAYDLTQLIGPTAPVVRGDELWFYYTGIKYRAQPKDADKKAGAVCLAVLRRDGFVSLSAGQQTGTLTTKQIISSGNRLRLNLAVHAGGQARVALVGDNNEPPPGYDLADCHPLTGDDVNQTVSWKSGTDVEHIIGQSIRLHIEFREADLYAFQFTDGD
jgi:hypothetical protein